MQEFIHTIKDEHGVHARPAGLIAAAARAFSSAVTVACGEKTADGKRLLALMSLGARQGDVLRFRIEGSDEDAAADALRRRCEEVI
ncbi:MAG: HPr family phosphocarrier protein [Clostridia bacterium]|nr:HPr family phosphocarrier protein [Clostridia bacterium]